MVSEAKLLHKTLGILEAMFDNGLIVCCSSKLVDLAPLR